MTTSSPAEANPGARRRAERRARRARKAAEEQARQQESHASAMSGAQLRNALRLARRNGIEPEDALDAVARLRERGIDPLEPANRLRLVIDNGAPAETREVVMPVLPGKSPAQLADEARHDADLARIRKDIARHRAHRANRLLLRLYMWVALPTLAALFYFAQVATPLYSTSAEFLVQKAAGPSAAGLLSGLGLGGAHEAVAVQSYILSAEALQRLDREHGFIAHFSADTIDPLTRLPADATLERAHRLYLKRIKVGYDPTEGIVRLQVRAADAATAVTFATALISYAEEVVDALSARQRRDQVAGARLRFDEAEAEVGQAQRRVLFLQEQRGVISADAEIAALLSRITALEAQLTEKRLELATLMDNPRPNQARVSAAERAIKHLETTVARLRDAMTATGPDQESLARISADLRVAETTLATRQSMFEEALRQLHSAQASADAKSGYLALNVAPVTPESAAYPRVPQNTAMAFLVFLGIYLLVSLTASVLKEQIAS